MSDVKTLILDIETFPTQAYVWGLFDQNVGLNQIIEPGGILCWSAKWVGDDFLYYSGLNMADREEMLLAIWEMMDEADEVVGWNSNSFDLKHLNTEFATVGLGPPSPYKKVDLLRTVKNNMKFVSNKLDFVSGQFGVGHKLEHIGFDMWVGCMKGDKKSWKIMREYNEQDVLLTERMYDKLRPWITSGVNRSSLRGDHVCPVCGGSHLQRRGISRTTTQVYQRWQCKCGAWSRSRLAEKREEKTQLVLAK